MSTKNELLEKVQATIDSQQDKLEKLKETAMDESHEAIDDIRAAIRSLEPKLDQAIDQAKEIADAADDKWDDLKDSLEAGWDEAGNSIEEGWDNLTDSIKNMFS